MQSAFKAVKITEHVFWVGAIDWTVRNFHGYATSRGSTYNAYLILDRKVTLVDTVKKPFYDEMVARIASVIDPKKIDYVVSNHAEPDHSGCLPETVALVAPEKVYAAPNGIKALEALYHAGLAIEPVKDGQKLDLGEGALTCVHTPMVHWPDSMVTYYDRDRVLFAQDGFGMHLASSERFADELPQDVVWYEAAKYFANILTPLSAQVGKVLERIQQLALPVDVLAHDHGPLWRSPSDIKKIVARYGDWCARKPEAKAVVVFDTMWKSTEKMARAIGEGIAERGVHVEVMPLDGSHRSDIATELLEAGGLVVGSPTINQNMFPSVADLLCYLKGLKFKNLVGGSFGSHGWSGQGADLVRDELQAMKVELVGEPLKIVYAPDDAAWERCRAYGERVGDAVLALQRRARGD